MPEEIEKCEDCGFSAPGLRIVDGRCLCCNHGVDVACEVLAFKKTLVERGVTETYFDNGVVISLAHELCVAALKGGAFTGYAGMMGGKKKRVVDTTARQDEYKSEVQIKE
jgi:hypothetical protein